MAEIGYYPLMTTAAGLELGGFPAHVYQWHREGFELARGTRLLATSFITRPRCTLGSTASSAAGWQPHSLVNA
jgi:hypothetical protein